MRVKYDQETKAKAIRLVRAHADDYLSKYAAITAVAKRLGMTPRNETPVHPSRGFEGRQQVRANWQRIFAGLPDVTATVLRTAVDGTTVWSEWELAGTRRDGSPQLLRGVIIFHTSQTEATSARFYLDPVETATLDREDQPTAHAAVTTDPERALRGSVTRRASWPA